MLISLTLFSIVYPQEVDAETDGNVNERTVINITDYGAVPDSGDDAGPAIEKAILAAKEIDGPVVINFPNGEYDFFPEGAQKTTYYISNTASEEQNPDVTKTIGILLKEVEDITIEGNDSLLLFHGKMTSVVVDKSTNITFQNIDIDYSRPTTSEMEVQEVGKDYLVANVHKDSLYNIEDNRIIWTSEPSLDGIPYWTYTSGNAQVYDPEEDTMRRTWNPGAEANNVEEIEPFSLKFQYDEQPDAEVGQIFTMREDVRDEVGMFIQKSQDINLVNTGMHYMHGLGIVFQFSKNLTVDNVDFAPRDETNRVTAGFADFLQVSGGKGLIKVTDSHFSGSNDDPINVHGTHLQIIDQPAPNQIVVRFMHDQTYGFDAFFPDDQIDFIDPDKLTAYDNAKVETVERKNDREFLLTLNEDVPDDFEVNDVIENTTWTPEVEISGNHFERVPTRGILVTTRNKVLIENNVFLRPQMSSILIANDASDWYESGMVKDVTIRGNNFIDSGNPAINIHPENKKADWEKTVHENILIEDNVFDMSDDLSVDIKSTQGFTFMNNEIISSNFNMNFNGSKDAEITGNTFDEVDDDKIVTLNNSLRSSFTINEEQGFKIVDQDELESAKLTTNFFELNRSNMSATATSYQADPIVNSPDNVLDGDDSTIWHSEWDPYAELPQSITLDLGGTYNIDRLQYLPRNDDTNGNITEYKIYISENGDDFNEVADGNWENTGNIKEASFSQQEASFVKLEAIEGQGGWASAAEIYIDEASIVSPGDQIPLELNVKKQNGDNQELEGVEITYYSENDDIAIVDDQGIVTALDNGSTVIQVKVKKDDITVEDKFPITVTEVSTANIKRLIDRFVDKGAFANDNNAHSLHVHLEAVHRFESQDKANKVIKHMNGFKDLLDHQIENEFISENAYNDLTSETDELIKKWQ